MQIDGGYTPSIAFENTNEFDTDFGAVFGGIDAEGVIDTRANNIGQEECHRGAGPTSGSCGIISAITNADRIHRRPGRRRAHQRYASADVEFSGQGSSPAIKHAQRLARQRARSAAPSSGTTGGSGVGLDLT